MWNKIIDCGKQITPNCRIRQIIEGKEDIYKVVEVESDQYKIQIVEVNKKPVKEIFYLTLLPDRIIQFNFEVEIKD